MYMRDLTRHLNHGKDSRYSLTVDRLIYRCTMIRLIKSHNKSCPVAQHLILFKLLKCIYNNVVV